MPHPTNISGVAEHKAGIRPQIAVVSANTLAAKGLSALIESALPVAEVRIFHNFLDLSEETSDKYYHYFVTPEVLLQNPSFFTARMKRTIVVVVGHMHTQIPKCFKTIDATQCEKDLVRSFLYMVQQAHGGGRLMPKQVRSGANGIMENDMLTPREKDVLREIVSGHINKEIADRLNIGRTSVVSHRRNIMEKLHARSVSALTIYAVMHVIVRIDEILFFPFCSFRKSARRLC